MSKTVEKKQKEKRGVSVRILNYVMCVVTLVVVVLMLFATGATSKRYSDVRNHTLNYIKWQSAAEQLKEGSDYLTEEVRAFTVTGDRTHLDNYFEEAMITRRRDNALQTIKENLEGTDTHRWLEEAMRYSMLLMEREYYAMRLTIESHGYDISEFPEQVRNVELDPKDAALSKEEMAERANEIVFDTIYHGYKEKISGETQRSISALADSTRYNIASSLDGLSNLLVVQHILMIGLAVVTITIIVLTSIHIISPLVRAIPRIKEEKPLPVRGAYEYKYLAKTYNKMFEANALKKEILTYEATHDVLTGILNRNGFEKAEKYINIERSALLLIDIDDFKHINDTYGHVVGDKVLIELAEELKMAFRSNDYVCRLGGDEFVVLMNDVDDSPERRSAIAAKAKTINKSLAESSNGTPPITISIGVAFGKKNMEITDLKSNADIALYSVKNNGKKSCAFYG
ncbi:MAG: GGDEF domain-containing protein [Clostridia bacterium]|nr:GGDEF domain-containing protein [Clostridia bacterium]